MLIDSHVHIGTFVEIKMPKEMVIKSMDKYHIDFSIVSNGSGCEVDHDQKPIPMEKQRCQRDINQEIIEFARANENKIGALLWAKPATEYCDEDFYNRYFDELKEKITEEDFQKLTYKNAIKVFGINKFQ